MAPRRKTVQSAFGASDISHVGQLYRRIREARIPTLTTVARWADVRPSTLSRFETSGTLDDVDTAPQAKRSGSFELFVDALCQTELDGDPVDPPLEQEYARLLRKIYDESRTPTKVLRQQAAFSYVTFETIKEASSTNHLRPLWELDQLLRSETRPAFIADPLWFIHSMNGACFNLFGIVPPDGHRGERPEHYLDRWEAWHVMGAKFTHPSPIRAAHISYNTYFPPAVDMFFRNLGPRLFILQSRALVHRLLTMSRKNNFLFPSWWKSATSMTMVYDRELLYRRIAFRDTTRPTSERVTIHAAADQVIERTVPMTPDGSITIPFWMGIWNGDDEQSSNLIKNLPGPLPNTAPFYAADFDRDRNFHVNTWPEVEPYLLG